MCVKSYFFPDWSNGCRSMAQGASNRSRGGRSDVALVNLRLKIDLNTWSWVKNGLDYECVNFEGGDQIADGSR